jgi:hypothetical protein
MCFLEVQPMSPGKADGLRKCSGHDEHHVTLYTYVTLYISKSRPALAGVVDRAPPAMNVTSPNVTKSTTASNI